MKKSLTLMLLFSLLFCYSQEISKIVFEHYQEKYFFRDRVTIYFDSIQNDKNSINVSVGLGTKPRYTLHISKRKYLKICKAVKKVNGYVIFPPRTLQMYWKSEDKITKISYSDPENIIHGGSRKNINKNSDKDFLQATKLILKTVNLQMKDLVGYQ